jgi:2-C-methyl-D-erythritol 4-phosphate cytidylyltransferase/2-C-methyl-D-erythritol 4-phosphate cytidylyltransferase/2-C-methyl-D-erythritol 2,4-cyclodiphosphate synthase
MDSSGAIAAVILAAGSSSRMGGVKKEYQKLKYPDGKTSEITVLGSSVRIFASVPSVETIIIAVPANEEDAARKTLEQKYLTSKKPEIIFVNGGSSRRVSVFNALCALANNNPRYVLIHDGARPWISVQLVEKIIEEVIKYKAVIPLIPLTDTPKECDAPIFYKEQTTNNKEQSVVYIKKHLKRAHTGIAQTPQAFAFPEILHAHRKAADVINEEFTDDAEIWGRFCGQVAVICGEQENRKITFPEDLN